MFSPKRQRIAPRLPSAARTLIIGVALILSALLTATALRNPALHWLAWISLLPLFQVIRTHRSAVATMAGGLWGGSVFLFAVVGASPIIPATLAAAALLITIPAIYTGLAAALTRHIGFNPFVLAVGWIGVELALTPLGLPLGIMAAAGTHGDLTQAVTQTDGIFLQWTAHLLGYVFIAFLVACFNAALIGILSGARRSIWACRSLAGPPIGVRRLTSQVILAIQVWNLRRAYPRAPPIHGSAMI